jgi:pimeloyl-ACP methyl ester carboxylesterase
MRHLPLLIVAAGYAAAFSTQSADAPPSGQKMFGPVRTDRFHTTFVRLSNNINGLLYQPETSSANARVAIVYSAPTPLFDFSPAAELASRGFRVLLVKHYHGEWRLGYGSPLDGTEETSRGITYVRALPGVERVVVMGHGAGGSLIALYANAAEHGTAAVCQRPELLYPCKAEKEFPKPDAVIMLDPSLGALETAIAVDPSIEGTRRSKLDFDMYAPANGYDTTTGRGRYSPSFVRQFFAAQSARNMQIVDNALVRLQVVQEGKGAFADNEPMVVPGAVNSGNPTRLYDTDLELLSHTRGPHLVLKADGSNQTSIVRSMRPAAGVKNIGPVGSCCDRVRYTLKAFLATDAIRTTSEFALSTDNITGVEWKSSSTSTPANAEGITVPSLVLSMSCSSSVVPAEIIYDHLAARDKTYAAVEGASHNFTACASQYGDTKKRTFDYLDRWLSARERFPVTPQAPSLAGKVPGSWDTDSYHTTFVKFGAENLEGLLLEPNKPGPKASVAILSVYPRANAGDGQRSVEFAQRGYRALWVMPYTNHDSAYDGLMETSAGISYLRTVPGVEKVIISGHSAGGRTMTFYANVGVNGPAGCQRPELVYPCRTEMVSGLAKPDGALLLDIAVGSVTSAMSVDPAYDGDRRSRTDLDMLSPANGYDPKTGTATYSDDFLKRFHAAQSARNMEFINRAIERQKLVDRGAGLFSGSEPLVIPGAVNHEDAVSPYRTDMRLLSRTKGPRLHLKADGTNPVEIIHSVRPPHGSEAMDAVGVLTGALNYTMRDWLINDAIRTTPDFAAKEDDIAGVVWPSSIDSPPTNAEHITIPTLVVTNTCYRLLTTSDIMFDHLAAKDKTFAGVEGALHNFTPCKPEFGDTKTRAFDFMDSWLSKPGRFLAQSGSNQ